MSQTRIVVTVDSVPQGSSMPRKAKVTLRKEQADLLLSGQPVVICLPGVDISEVELQFEVAQPQTRREDSSMFDFSGSETCSATFSNQRNEKSAQIVGKTGRDEGAIRAPKGSEESGSCEAPETQQRGTCKTNHSL